MNSLIDLLIKELNANTVYLQFIIIKQNAYNILFYRFFPSKLILYQLYKYSKVIVNQDKNVITHKSNK